jgi:hypothetical protein
MPEKEVSHSVANLEEPRSPAAMENDELSDSKSPEDAAVLALLAAQDLPLSAANMIECYDRDFVSVSANRISPPVRS